MSQPSRNLQSSTFTKSAPLVSFVPAAYAYYIYAITNPQDSLLENFYFVVPLTLSLAALSIIPHTRSILAYYLSQSAVVAFYLLTVPTTAENPGIQTAIHIIILIEIILYEPFPINLSESLLLTIVVFILDALILVPSTAGGTLSNIVLVVALPATVLSIVGSLMTKYREIVVQLVADRERLTNSVVELTRANSEYQDYAVVVREDATEMERRRITRDIHDIVGYTLTNNMMLMEAAMDLLKENALALPSIIETARENAQEGLDQVRTAMYRLREQENASPIGLNAVVRLSQIFERATGIKVHREFGSMPVIISDEIDSTIYHLVQEALVNAFRHGNATEIHVLFWYTKDEVEINVRDDGMGTDKVEEGIGIAGMRERVEKVGGTLSAQGVVDGFLVRARIPLDRTY